MTPRLKLEFEARCRMLERDFNRRILHLLQEFKALDKINSTHERKLKSTRYAMTSPTGIIPESLMSPGHKGEVIELIKRLPVEGDDKEKLLIAWAQAVGAHISGSQRRAVRFSGTDY